MLNTLLPRLWIIFAKAMYNRLLGCFLLGILLVSACRKKGIETTAPVTQNTVETPAIKNEVVQDHNIAAIQGYPVKPVDVTPDSFVAYLIKKGNNYCEKNTYPVTSYTSLHFRAILDSSCIYTTADPANQQDINKLFGFADCSSFHQDNSARFGWDWYQGQMHIHAYCYAAGVRSYKELGVVELNRAFDCRLLVLPGQYVFTLNGKSDTMTRGCTVNIASGYKLYPYFGGNETAPHDVKVKIREF